MWSMGTPWISHSPMSTISIAFQRKSADSGWRSIRRKTPHIRVRMIGIDTPETVHPSKAVQQYGMEASNYVRSLILDKNVELEFDTEIWDKYQRLLAYVYFDGALIQAKILQRGLAYAYRRYPFLQAPNFRLLRRRQSGRSSGSGLIRRPRRWSRFCRKNRKRKSLWKGRISSWPFARNPEWFPPARPWSFKSHSRPAFSLHRFGIVRAVFRFTHSFRTACSWRLCGK